MPKITTITQMLFSCARFVPGFLPSFGVCPAFIGLAESEGFEPPVRRNAYTAFRVRLFRPLRQLSSKAGAKVQQNFHIRKFFTKIMCKICFLPSRYGYSCSLRHLSTRCMQCALCPSKSDISQMPSTRSIDSVCSSISVSSSKEPSSQCCLTRMVAIA